MDFLPSGGHRQREEGREGEGVLGGEAKEGDVGVQLGEQKLVGHLLVGPDGVDGGEGHLGNEVEHASPDHPGLPLRLKGERPT